MKRSPFSGSVGILAFIVSCASLMLGIVGVCIFFAILGAIFDELTRPAVKGLRPEELEAYEKQRKYEAALERRRASAIRIADRKREIEAAELDAELAASRPVWTEKDLARFKAVKLANEAKWDAQGLHDLAARSRAMGRRNGKHF